MKVQFIKDSTGQLISTNCINNLPSEGDKLRFKGNDDQWFEGTVEKRVFRYYENSEEILIYGFWKEV